MSIAKRVHKLAGLTTGMIFALVAYAALVAPPDRLATQTYIVQGQDLNALKAAVATAGGEITHSLGIIRAVGARLTSDQVAQLRQSGLVTRIYEDRELQTTGTCSVSAEPQLSFDKKKLFWGLTNSGATPVTLNRLALTWPAANGEFKRVTLGNRKIANDKLPPQTAVIEGAQWEGELADRQIEGGDTLVLGIEFSKSASTQFDAYTLSAQFAEACSVDYTGAAPTPRLAGAPTLQFDNQKVDWTIDNQTASTLRIASITLNWPSGNGVLKKVKLDGDEISNVVHAPGTALLAGAWHDDVRRREIAPFSSETLRFEFDRNAGRSEKLYAIEVAFETGEKATFTPPNAACRLAAEQQLAFDNNKVLWTVTSADADLITIDQFDLAWPLINGKLKKIRLDGEMTGFHHTAGAANSGRVS